jgi:hypothetical protein
LCDSLKGWNEQVVPISDNNFFLYSFTEKLENMREDNKSDILPWKLVHHQDIRVLIYLLQQSNEYHEKFTFKL